MACKLENIIGMLLSVFYQEDQSNILAVMPKSVQRARVDHLSQETLQQRSALLKYDIHA